MGLYERMYAENENDIEKRLAIKNELSTKCRQF